MKFDLEEGIEILERTPAVLGSMLEGISGNWSTAKEGSGTWTPYDVIGHLIHGEKTDWIPRMEIILSDAPERRFTPFDRFAQLTTSGGKELKTLLEEFGSLRRQNVATLKARSLGPADMSRTAIHPELGEVTLEQLLATWVVHDLDHIAQVVRVMARQYQAAVGPWIRYLKVLRS